MIKQRWFHAELFRPDRDTWVLGYSFGDGFVLVQFGDRDDEQNVYHDPWRPASGCNVQFWTPLPDSTELANMLCRQMQGEMAFESVLGSAGFGQAHRVVLTGDPVDLEHEGALQGARDAQTQG